MNIETIMVFLLPLLMGLFMILIFRSLAKKVLGVLFQSKNAQSEMKTQDNNSKPAKNITNYLSIIIALMIFGGALGQLGTGYLPGNIIDTIGSLFSITILIVIAKAGHGLFKTHFKDFQGLQNSQVFQNLKNSKNISAIKNLATTSLASELPLFLVVKDPQMLKSIVSTNSNNKNYINNELDKITKIKNLEKLNDVEYDFMGTHQDTSDHRYRMKMDQKNKNQIVKLTRYS